MQRFCPGVPSQPCGFRQLSSLPHSRCRAARRWAWSAVRASGATSRWSRLDLAWSPSVSMLRSPATSDTFGTEKYGFLLFSRARCNCKYALNTTHPCHTFYTRQARLAPYMSHCLATTMVARINEEVSQSQMCDECCVSTSYEDREGALVIAVSTLCPFRDSDQTRLIV